MPYAVDTKTGELKAARDLPAEVFTDLDRLDDDQIVAELKGSVLDEYVYSFPQGNGTIVGLSWVGAREAARHYQGIHIGEPKISQDDESWTIMVQVTDRVRDLILWGAATVPKKMKTKNGDVPDNFAFNKALSKAQRNALLSVLPTAVIVKTIQAFVDAKRGVRQVGRSSGNGTPPESPARPASRPPAPPPQAPENMEAPPDEDAFPVEETRPAPADSPRRQAVLKWWDGLWAEARDLHLDTSQVVVPNPHTDSDDILEKKCQELQVAVKRAKAGAESAGAPTAQPQGGSGLSTPNQVRAIYSIGRDQLGLDETQLDEESVAVYGVPPAELTKRLASDFITALKARKA